jgi:hypothetical protein
MVRSTKHYNVYLNLLARDVLLSLVLAVIKQWIMWTVVHQRERGISLRRLKRMEPERKTVEDIANEIKEQMRFFWWNENIVSRISAMKKIEHLAHVAVQELENEHII